MGYRDNVASLARVDQLNLDALSGLRETPNLIHLSNLGRQNRLSLYQKTYEFRISNRSSLDLELIERERERERESSSKISGYFAPLKTARRVERASAALERASGLTRKTESVVSRVD